MVPMRDIGCVNLLGILEVRLQNISRAIGNLTGGFSGGPLVEYISGAGYVAIGIHKDGSTIDGSSYPTSYTGALRITQSLYTLFLSYRG